MPLTTHTVVGRKAERILLFLHGFGADERDLASLLPHLDPEGRFVAVLPRAQYSGPVGYAWYQLDAPPAVVANQLKTSMQSVEEVLTDACESNGMPRSDAIFAGFSQGGSIAISLAYGAGQGPRPVGVLVMSGFLPQDESFAFDWSGQLPPALVQHGTEDKMMPPEISIASARFLASNGVPLVHRTYPMEHQVSMESVKDAKAWLDDVRRGERPNQPIEGPDAEPATQPDEPAQDDDALVRNVSSRSFDKEVLQSTVPVIVDFWAPWCQPCRMVSPIVEQIAAMRQGAYKVVKVNIDEAPDIAQKFEVKSIPMIGLFRNGRLERASMGAKSRPQIEAELGMLVIP